MAFPIFVSLYSLLDLKNKLACTGFDNYHKIAIRDHVRVPKFWCDILGQIP